MHLAQVVKSQSFSNVNIYIGLALCIMFVICIVLVELWHYICIVIWCVVSRYVFVAYNFAMFFFNCFVLAQLLCNTCFALSRQRLNL